MKNILFIRGFGTDNIKTSDTYANIYIILSQDVNKIVRYVFQLQPERRHCKSV